VAAAAAILVSTAAASMQARREFRARLSPVPVDTVTARTTTGSGSLTAVLEGETLTIKGTFEGMNSPATAAHIHRAPRGLRGPNVFDLKVTPSTNGAVEGRVTLTSAQITDLDKGWFFVQVHTELNAAGQLRGWILK
jgi:hypothetical protein